MNVTKPLQNDTPVSGCFSCKTQEYSQSTVPLDLGTTSILHMYWLTDDDEIDSFGYSIPNFDT